MHLLKKKKKPEYKIIHIVHSCVVPGSKYIVMFHFYEMFRKCITTETDQQLPRAGDESREVHTGRKELKATDMF